MELQTIKNIISEMKNTLNGFKSRSDTAKGKTNELEIIEI